MAEVAPTEEIEVTEQSSTDEQPATVVSVKFDAWTAAGGILYVVGSIALSCVYLFQIQSSLANDYWWPDFNSTGVQTFLGDVYNMHLMQGSRGKFPLWSGDVVYSRKPYAGNDTRMEWSASYGRAILLDNIPLRMAVQALRLRTFEANMMMVAPYCWLDFNRSFAMAHTFKRQERCEATKRDNAALYIEALTRNCDARAMYTTTQRYEINTTILAPLRVTPEGRRWIQAMEMHQLLPIPVEVLFWKSRGLLRWKTNVQNLRHDGIVDTINIRNALGFDQPMQIKKMSAFGRSMGRWTTLAAYGGIWNDLYMCAPLGASVLLHANNSLPHLGIDWDVDLLAPPNTVGANLVRQYIGPFMSIDIELVPPPPLLRSTFRDFQQFVGTTYKYRATRLPPGVDVDPMPRSWRGGPDRLFYGGNPVCPFGSGRPFIQPSFGYYDDCTAQTPHSLRITPDAALFAIFLTSPLSVPGLAVKSCRLCSVEASQACVTFLTIMARHRLNESLPERLEIYEDTVGLEVAFIQFASENNSAFVLTQPMITMDTDDPWAFFGWVVLYDWLQGQREVYRFEGDAGNVTLVTQPHPEKFSIQANPIDLQSHACKYIWYISVYVSFVLGAVGVLAIVYGVVHRLRFDGAHLLRFNRLVGSVWVGRPLLYVRGMTAIVIMSTFPVSLDKIGGISLLQRNRRSFLESFLLAGEGTWLTYVVQDVFTPVTRPWGLYIPMSSTLVWWILMGMEMDDITEVTPTIQQTCVVEYLGNQVSCESGTVEIGSMATLTIGWAVSAAVPAFIMLTTAMCQGWKVGQPEIIRPGIPSLLPSAAAAYLPPRAYLDSVTSVMCGILLYGSGVFDIKVWRTVPEAPASVDGGATPAGRPQLEFGTRRRVLVYLGLGYMVATVATSYSYLVVTESTMANDFWWPGFNSTGHQTFLTNWFNTQLLLTSVMPATQIDQPKYADIVSTYDSIHASILTAPTYSATIQRSVYSNLPVVIQGLRDMDSCTLPWIAASHCFVDFGQTWEMAVSADRQAKCTLDRDNGAVYLESILRNAHWPTLRACWGAALALAVFDEVGRTSRGVAWVAAVTSDTKPSVADEVATWLSYNITAFTPAWQNYKHIGVTETVDVTSAFGLAYPLTIRNVPSMYHSAATPTSFRMQWPLAKTLWAVSNNSSGVGGSSLVRSSPVYAFGNASSMEALLARNQTVEFPLGWRLALTRQTFGPFGTVVMTRVEPPLALRALYRELTEAIVGAIGHNATTLHAYMSVRTMSMFTPCTMAWRYQCTVGGNFMCDGGKVLTREMSEFFALDGSCSSNGNDQTLNNGHTTMAAVLSQAVRGDELVQSTCAHETLARPSCEQVMQQGLAFIASTPLLSSTLAALADVTQATKRTIQATLAPQVVQFTWDCQVGSATALSHIGVFDEPTFEFFAWLYMFEWVLGYREVVQFTGASKPTMTVVSGRPLVMRFDVNSQEIPQNMAFYIRCTIQYFTIVLLAIAVGVCISIVLSRGYIEGMNMFQFNRVAALVWIGRPLVLLRGVTAVCILSTATLRLDLPAMGATFTQFVSGPPDTMTTLLSCGEMGWVVYILNDVFSVMTGQVTSRYAWKSSVGVWLAASVWSLVSPVRHAVSIDRQCTADVVDFTLSCHSATFEIGQVDRFVGLLGLAGVGCVVSYAIERGLGSRGANTQISTSLLLHSVAQFQFEQTPWLCGGMYYLDRASAMLNGLVSIRAPNGAYLVMDVKTWQWFVVPVPDTPCTPMPPSFVHAIPLAN